MSYYITNNSYSDLGNPWPKELAGVGLALTQSCFSLHSMMSGWQWQLVSDYIPHQHPLPLFTTSSISIFLLMYTYPAHSAQTTSVWP